MPNKTYNHEKPIVFDQFGRCLIFDSISATYAYKANFFNTLISVLLPYKAYTAYYAEPYSAAFFYGWSVLSSMIYLANSGRYMEYNKSVSRIYLLEQGFAMRIEMRNGRIFDLPISAVSIG